MVERAKEEVVGTIARTVVVDLVVAGRSVVVILVVPVREEVVVFGFAGTTTVADVSLGGFVTCTDVTAGILAVTLAGEILDVAASANCRLSFILMVVSTVSCFPPARSRLDTVSDVIVYEFSITQGPHIVGCAVGSTHDPHPDCEANPSTYPDMTAFTSAVASMPITTLKLTENCSTRRLHDRSGPATNPVLHEKSHESLNHPWPINVASGIRVQPVHTPCKASAHPERYWPMPHALQAWQLEAALAPNADE